MEPTCGTCAWIGICANLDSAAKVHPDQTAGICWTEPESTDHAEQRGRLASCSIGRKMLHDFDRRREEIR